MNMNIEEIRKALDASTLDYGITEEVEKILENIKEQDEAYERAVSNLYYMKGIIEALKPDLLIYPNFKSVLDELKKGR